MHLPRPPDERELFLYLDQGKKSFYFFGFLSTAMLFLGGFLFALHKPEFHWFFFFLFVNFLHIGIAYFVGFASKPFKLEEHWDFIRMGNDLRDAAPSIDIYLPSAGEKLHVLLNTYNFVKELKWSNLKVYVLDDSGRREVSALAEMAGFEYIARKDPGVLKKAGNVRNAFKQTNGDFILILDADFVPRRDIFNHMMPYFLDPKVAIVQSPQFFRVTKEMPWIQKGASTIQELFYRLIQVNRDYFNAAICVGTCAIYRRKAFEELGGTYPISHSEDVHTGFWATTKGYKVKYIPLNLAAGLSPDTVDDFMKQQNRWASGSTSLFLNKELFWKSKITKMQRVSYLSGMLYYQATALSVIMNQIPAILMVWFSSEHVFWYNMALSVPSFLFGTIFMMFWNKQPYGLFAIKARMVSYVAYLFAIKDIFTKSLMPWEATGKERQSKLVTRKLLQMKALMLTVSGGSYVILLTGIMTKSKGLLDYNFYPMLFFGTFWFLLSTTALLGEFNGSRRRNSDSV